MLRKVTRSLLASIPLRFAKGFLRDHVSQLVSGAKDDARPKAKLALDRILDQLRQRSDVLRVCPEDDVAALYVGLRVAQAERRIEVTQRVHLDLVVASNIDATEHGDNDGHGRQQHSAPRPISGSVASKFAWTLN